MKNKVLLECDSFTIDQFKQWLDENQYFKNFIIYALVKPLHFKTFKEELAVHKNIIPITYQTIFEYQAKKTVNAKSYFDFINFYLNDQITSRLLDRDGYWPSFGTGNQNAFHYHSEAANHALMFLEDHAFQFIYFRESPHISKEWLLAKCADFLNLKIYISEQFVFTWLFTIKEGYKRFRKPVLNQLDLQPSQRLKDDLSNYVKMVSDKYEIAIPSYEKGRIGQGFFKFYNPFREIKESIKRPHRFINKTKNYLFYKKNAKEINVKNLDYFVFFMHYQPERTSLPEGYEFSDQFFAIQILSKLLPKGIKLIVKEHPSMFTYESEPKFRTIFNYKSLLNIDNIELCSLNINSFELIDHALGVATITGTSAIESYIRKKPVIVFGRNNLNVDGVHGFKNVEDLELFVRKVCEKKIQIDNVSENLYNMCVHSAMSGIPEDTTESVDYYTYKKSFQEIAHYKLLSQVLKLHDAT